MKMIDYVPRVPEEIPQTGEDSAGWVIPVVQAVGSFFVSGGSAIASAAIGASKFIGAALTGSNFIGAASTAGKLGTLGKLGSAAGTLGKLGSTASTIGKLGSTASTLGKLGNVTNMAGTLGKLGNVANVGKGLVQTGGTGGSIMDAIRSFGGNILDYAKSPRGIADITMMALGELQGPSELDGAVAARRAELAALSVSDRVAYDEQIATARQLVSRAQQFDPVQLGLQTASQQQQVSNAEERSGLREAAARGYSATGQRSALRRQYGIGAGANKANAFARGYDSGVARQTGLFGEARQWYPQPLQDRTGSSNIDYAQLQDEQRNEANAGLGGFLARAITRTPKPREKPTWGGA